jgi:hypothetical protein
MSADPVPAGVRANPMCRTPRSAHGKDGPVTEGPVDGGRFVSWTEPEPPTSWTGPEPAAADAGAGSRAFVSWTTPGPAVTEAGTRRRARSPWADRGWGAAVLPVLLVLIFDFVAALLGSILFSVGAIITSRSCIGACGLHAELHQVQLQAWIVLPLVAVPPVAVALLRRKLRVTVVVLQVIVLAGLGGSSLARQHTLHARIAGTAPCWNPAYSPKDCPWGGS